MEITRTSSSDYALGHSQHELDRLISQGKFIGDLTEHVLRLAGITSGLRVLDVGCGAGDVSFLARTLVGTDGAVIGVDRSPDALAVARQRAQQAKLSNVEFIAADLEKLTLDQPVDALIGRLVLMYCPQPAAVLRHLLSFVRPGGIVAFQELDMESAVAQPMCDEFRMAGHRVNQTLTRAGVDLRIGLKLPWIFQEAGLPAPQMLQLARVEHGPASQAYTWIEQLTRTVLPLMEKTGVATAEDVGVDTLAARMRDEVVAKNAVLVLPPFIGAWARKQAPGQAVSALGTAAPLRATS
jgi:ubiquinone/menaquinone biosynthesis C-methylase UbiE